MGGARSSGSGRVVPQCVSIGDPGYKCGMFLQ